MKKILVLGANGFLGSHFCKILKKKNYKIYPLVRYSSDLSRFKILNKNKNYKILKYKSIKDVQRIRKIINKYKINFIINFAAHGVLFKKTAKKFKIFNEINYLSVKKLLKNCSKTNLERYIHIGTISEFGKQENKIYEGLKENAFDNYSLSKLNLTHYLKNEHDKDILPYTLLRLFPVYGPLENKNKLFPYLIYNLKKKHTVKLTSGRQIRNYTYVDDMSHGIIKCIESKKTINQSLILGNNKCDSLKNIVNDVVDLMRRDKDLIIWNNISRKDESINYIPNLKKTFNMIQWKSKTSLKSGLKKMLQYL